MKIEIELLPFSVPNFVIAKTEPKPCQEGFSEAPKFHLREVSETALSDLCDAFRASVFSKAEKFDPKL